MAKWETSATDRVRNALARRFQARERPSHPAALRIFDRPTTDGPIMLAAFEGWNDAGEAASYAVAHLSEITKATLVAEVDPEEFYDFTDVRPSVAVDNDGTRKTVWPTTSFSFVRGQNGARDLVIVRGPEPQLHWRTYCEAIVEVAKLLSVECVVTLGAYLAEITHDRPVPVNSHSADPVISARESLSRSLYEGPTGIVGVLGTALAEAGIPAVSIWASVPCHSLPVSPKAALALLRAAGRYIKRSDRYDSLEAEANEYETRMDQLIEEDEHVAAYVARIEEMEEQISADLSPDALAEEIERYLRGRRSI